MNAPNPAVPLDRPDKIDDILRLYLLVKQTPGLPMPTVSPARATFDYREVIYDTTDAVAAALILRREFTRRESAVRFTPVMRLADDGTPRYLMEAELPSGLTLVIVSRFEHAWPAVPSGQDEHQDTGELVAA